MKLDVKRLRLLREVSLRGSIAAAAHALCYTPSAVSQQLASLERDAGATLLERSGRRVRLTESGRALAAHTEEVLVALERTEAAIRSTDGKVSGTVRIGAFATAAAALAPEIVRRLAFETPELIVAFSEYEPDDGLPALKLGELDLLIASEYDHGPWPRDQAVHRTELFSDPLRLVRPLHWDAKSVADTEGLPWAAATPSAARMATFNACRAEGFEPEVRYSATDYRVLVSMVASGLAVALVPDLALAQHPGLSGVWVSEVPVLNRRVHAVYRRGSEQRPAIAAARLAIEQSIPGAIGPTAGSGLAAELAPRA